MGANEATEPILSEHHTISLDFLREVMGAGYYISRTPALTHSPPHQEAIREAPSGRMLLETDCPVEHQGRTTRPRDVFITLTEVSRQGIAFGGGCKTHHTECDGLVRAYAVNRMNPRPPK